MATFASFLSSSPPPPLLFSSSSHHNDLPCFSLSFAFSHLPNAALASNPRKIRTLILASSNSASSFDDLVFDRKSGSADKKSILSDLIQEIEPLDVSLIQRDVPPTTLDAMKRTISGMLGLLPSDRFKVLIEALWEPLSKLLISSIMTGYTLRNAEYRLCLEKNFEYEGNTESQEPENSKLDLQGTEENSEKMNQYYERNAKLEKATEDLCDNIGIQGLGEVSPEAQQYILDLQSRLSSVKKELHEVKRKSAALQMQQFVGEEKNDLLDYLRSLKPEKGRELAFGLTVGRD
ncbi:uncharacterized protein LOC105650737 isoform X2 [Jatropha curcas]|uniref:uncharacterized protein LOC105650737 isoform X2 n=1 Tax=Jatropha curcas TaxID=180498 RepID=UPI0009D73286|nr:uncharacterized protein LOC105650737 isoform X2 [Jatropha curcas]